MEPNAKANPIQSLPKEVAPLLPCLFDQIDRVRITLENIVNRLPRFREFQGLDPDKLIANEIEFQKRVLSALSLWNEQGPSYVLWDKDGTIGDYRHVGDQIGWFFRPGIIEILKSAPTLFPNLRHGILSHRHHNFLQESFEPGGQFYELHEVFDRNHIYSSRGYELYSEEELHQLSGVQPNHGEDRSSYIKFARLRELQSNAPGIRFRSIDDLSYTMRLGIDGLYVGDLLPDQIIRVLALGCALETGEYPYLRYREPGT
jgi:hypothetical protein